MTERESIARKVSRFRQARNGTGRFLHDTAQDRKHGAMVVDQPIQVNQRARNYLHASEHHSVGSPHAERNPPGLVQAPGGAESLRTSAEKRRVHFGGFVLRGRALVRHDERALRFKEAFHRIERARLRSAGEREASQPIPVRVLGLRYRFL